MDLMKRHLVLYLVSLIFSGCNFSSFDSIVPTGSGGNNSTPVTNNPTDEYLSKLSQGLASGGLSSTEVSVIIASAREELAASSVPSSAQQKMRKVSSFSSSNLLDSIPVMARGAMKALGSETFSSDEKKQQGVSVVAEQIFSVFSEELAQEDPTSVGETIKSAVQEQIKASGQADLSASAVEVSFKKIVEESVKSIGAINSDHSQRMSIISEVTNVAINSLDEAGLDSEKVKSTVPKVVAGSMLGMSSLPNTSSEQRSELMIQLMEKVYVNINSIGLASSDIFTVSSNISDEVSTIVAADPTLPASTGTNLTSVIQEGNSCIASSKWVFMFEYSDPSCQILDKKYIDGPIVNSPMNKGFPNHGFCYRNPENGKYYNWVGGPVGCQSEPPSLTSFPPNPSPRNFAVNTSAVTGCFTSMSSGGSISSPESEIVGCLSNGLLNFLNNGSNKFVVIRHNDHVQAVFDQAPVGITFPSISKLCKLYDGTGTHAMHAIYSRNADECLKMCDHIVSLFPQYSNKCNLDGTFIKEYAANTYIAPPPPPPITKFLKWDVKTPIASGACAATNIKLMDEATQAAVNGDNLSVSLYKSKVSFSLGIITPMFFFDSNCTYPMSWVLLPPDSAGKTVYVKIPENATSLELVATPNFLGTAEGRELIQISN